MGWAKIASLPLPSDPGWVGCGRGVGMTWVWYVRKLTGKQWGKTCHWGIAGQYCLYFDFLPRFDAA